MITARVSSKGQIAIPKPIREQAGMEAGVVVSVSVEDRGVLLRKVPRGQKPWMRWRGALKGSGALRELEREHRQEVQRDKALTKKRNAQGA